MADEWGNIYSKLVADEFARRTAGRKWLGNTLYSGLTGTREGSFNASPYINPLNVASQYGPATLDALNSLAPIRGAIDEAAFLSAMIPVTNSALSADKLAKIQTTTTNPQLMAKYLKPGSDISALFSDSYKKSLEDSSVAQRIAALPSYLDKDKILAGNYAKQTDYNVSPSELLAELDALSPAGLKQYISKATYDPAGQSAITSWEDAIQKGVVITDQVKYKELTDKLKTTPYYTAHPDLLQNDIDNAQSSLLIKNKDALISYGMQNNPSLLPYSQQTLPNAYSALDYLGQQYLRDTTKQAGFSSLVDSLAPLSTPWLYAAANTPTPATTPATAAAITATQQQYNPYMQQQQVNPYAAMYGQQQQYNPYMQQQQVNPYAAMYGQQQQQYNPYMQQQQANPYAAMYGQQQQQQQYNPYMQQQQANPYAAMYGQQQANPYAAMYGQQQQQYNPYMQQQQANPYAAMYGQQQQQYNPYTQQQANPYAALYGVSGANSAGQQQYNPYGMNVLSSMNPYISLLAKQRTS